MTENAAHLSIGEVLAELRDEFPDITISKIRFLESQGLIDPERTPSGYRKFYRQDLARLRWILHQQKEHFLPLKVIKERLEQSGPGDPLLLGGTRDVPRDAAPDAPSARGRTGRSPSSAGRATPGAPAFVPTLPTDDGEELARAGTETYSRRELAAAAGIETSAVEALESFGLVSAAFEAGGEPRFDADALEIARAAAGFFARGVEARHLRMYRTFADREAVLFGQVLLPYVRQRNPEARVRLQEELVELARLGRALRSVLLREAVRESLTE